ncbi:hypothetical protein [Streptomyces bauhiniae]
MAVMIDGERLLDELPISTGRRRMLWERAERLRIGVDSARAHRDALAARRVAARRDGRTAAA